MRSHGTALNRGSFSASASVAPRPRPPRAVCAAEQRAGSVRRLAPARAVPGGGFDLSAIPREALAAGSAALAGVAAAVAAIMGNAGSSAAPAGAAGAGGALAPRENAVLVLGATGKAGRMVVDQLLKNGRTVVAAARSGDKALEVFSALGLKEGRQGGDAAGGGGGGVLFVETGVDVTDEATLTEDLFRGVTQVVSALGGVAGRLPGGGFGFIDGMTPEAVEAKGTANVVAAMKRFMAPAKMTHEEILPMRTAEEVAVWERLDDVIMGGSSKSGFEADGDGGAVWRGDLITEGGGFCGARTSKLGLDLSGFDGLRLRVKSDGQTFKFNIKTADQEDTPESTYQATFGTSEEGDWTTAHIPFSSFVPVKRAQSDPQGEPLKGDSISKLGLVLSRFEFNGKANPRYHPGPFELRIAGGVSAYRAPRPQLVLLSSAGVERNALIGDDAEARKREIPIIQLNPGGVLNWKYGAECAARDSGFPYAVVRCTGLDDSSAAAAEPRLLEASQGDSISGRVSRAEAAAVIAAACDSPAAVGKTFELRRCEAADAAGKASGPAQLQRLFLTLASDSDRWRVGLQPFPRFAPPPPPPSEERTKEILADPRVQEVSKRNAAQRAQAEQADGKGEQTAEGDEGEKGDKAEGEKAKELVTAAK